MHRITKIVLILLSVLIALSIVVIIFISPITKYLVEKYDLKYTGREIKMDWAYVNPFTGYVHLSNFKIYELKSDSVFLSGDGLSINFAMLKLFNKTYEVSALTLDKPRGHFSQVKRELNFKDIIEKFSSKDTIVDSLKVPLHLNILNFKINNGEFHYTDKLLPINYFIKNVNIESTGKRWDVDTVDAKFAFQSGIGNGDIKGDFTLNTKNNDYRLAVVVNKFDLQIVEQYLKDVTNYGTFTATLDANMKSTGNLKHRENVSNSGHLTINDFHFGKTREEDYISFDKLAIAIDELTPKNFVYHYDSVVLYHPYFKYEKYDHLDNLQNMFGKKGSKFAAAKADKTQFNLVIEVANYIKMLGRNLFKSNYKVNKLAIYGGNIKYNDFSVSEKFSVALNPLNIVADSIDKKKNRVKVFLDAGIKPYGTARANLSINPKDSSQFDLVYNFQKIPVAMLNPIIITYTSFPLDRGTIEMNGNWHVRNGTINSDNHLLLIDTRASEKVKNKGRKWLPIPLILAFIRERGNVMDYTIPITGNLKNPKFHLRDVIFDLIKNIFVKPPTTPYGIEVKNVETKIEKLLTIKWEMRQTMLSKTQKKFIEKMVTFLKKNSDASISVYPQQYAAKEKEYILFFEAKKKYFLAAHNIASKTLNEKDSITIERMSIKDAAFVAYLKQHIKGTSNTIQGQCAKFVGSDIIESKYKSLNKARTDVFMSYFAKDDVAKKVKMNTAQEVVPYNGFSYYKIDYKGELPNSLMRAYRKMNDLDNKAPRKQFEKKREKNGHLFK